MTIRVAINGFGRIGRNVLRALYENGYRDRVQVVAINDLGDPSLNSHLLRHDTVHGHFPFSVEHDAESISVDGDRITISSERDPANLPWASMDIDLVMECTGLFTKREAAAKHIAAGAKRVLISAPSPDADATIVYGVNDHILTAEHTVVSNASCTTNCLAPVAKALNDAVGIENGLMTTVHAYTNDQNLSDVYHSDPYRARSATHSMIPTKTGAAAAVGLVLPELAGKFDGLAVRVPVINVSLVDLTFTAGRDTTKEEINAIVEKAAANSPVLAVNAQPLVSIDFNHDAHSSTFDANHTRVNGRLVKIMAWYDNEWGFSNRMLDTAIAMQKTAK
ncbi:MAG: type I glyceraldehyde-3-phosphate dehydrogenase [Halomonas sp.]|jgi:glyceraldehyde 3-phosphate dehydrogenase|uniref:type I glyceraldehyde-3-phosphate dehydrogenase n=1 Tax=Halomonadaceae TaxID=28256 RepID=UPI001E3E16E3|nr:MULTISPECIES: type I glyceraldehyde-3-phosphate dehydrogenase [Halomonas]MCD1651899.1 type I glyceraldehyde-3-phosphate dehydrogenase [Halomonas axialensis]MCD2086472.1 type I glyceraldehyde-3-phosphate dehydrogenase [Halomonas meridiana]MCF2913232.1 type I glyceraldehyde-3-phosphate dehydrogenase [Halomonas sp. Cn5-12]MDM7480908.1 type I glyceraldehyde-3-phosphate dehydrogenase [Halomonas sp.]|tara:strand:+ start:2038 stop:3042 length:1005 start_codon:yes stop_codon:yes gene_type:complete